jgi:hypothetical protein
MIIGCDFRALPTEGDGRYAAHPLPKPQRMRHPKKINPSQLQRQLPQCYDPGRCRVKRHQRPPRVRHPPGELGFGSGPAFGLDPFGFGVNQFDSSSTQTFVSAAQVDTRGGQCIYLDSAGTGFNSGEGATGGGIDGNSTAGGCQQTGGFFVDQSYGNVMINELDYDPDSNNIFVQSSEWSDGWNVGTIGIPGQSETQSINYGDITTMVGQANWQVGWQSLSWALSGCALDALDWPPGVSTKSVTSAAQCVSNAMTSPNVGGNP